MEKIIKFKAKRLDNSEWVEGDLLHKDGKTYIYGSYIDESGVYIEDMSVDPSTVCQFTGLKDRDENDIFEGDILAERNIPMYDVGYIDCGFAASYIGEETYIFNLLALSKDCVVCGSKFDRKEGEK